MKNLSLLIIVLLLNNSCSDSKQNTAEDFVMQYNSGVLEKAGETLYNTSCIQCHRHKNATHNLLTFDIRNDKYEFDFLKNYINHQDSLLQNGNELALKMKEDWNTEFIHNYNFSKKEIKAIVYYLKKK